MCENSPVQPDAEILQLQEQYYQAVLTYMLRLTKDEDDAKDYTATAFERLWYKLREGYKIESPLGWLCRVAKNEFLDSVRTKKNHPTESLDQMIAWESSDQTRSIGSLRKEHLEDPMYNQPDIIAESNEGVRKIYSEIIKLPVRLRPATFLRLFEGLKHSEIAEQLVQPPGTVRPHVREGLERLQEAMLPWLNEGT